MPAALAAARVPARTSAVRGEDRVRGAPVAVSWADRPCRGEAVEPGMWRSMRTPRSGRPVAAATAAAPSPTAVTVRPAPRGRPGRGRADLVVLGEEDVGRSRRPPGLLGRPGVVGVGLAADAAGRGPGRSGAARRGTGGPDRQNAARSASISPRSAGSISTAAAGRRRPPADVGERPGHVIAARRSTRIAPVGKGAAAAARRARRPVDGEDGPRRRPERRGEDARSGAAGNDEETRRPARGAWPRRARRAHGQVEGEGEGRAAPSGEARESSPPMARPAARDGEAGAGAAVAAGQRRRPARTVEDALGIGRATPGPVSATVKAIRAMPSAAPGRLDGTETPPARVNFTPLPARLRRT